MSHGMGHNMSSIPFLARKTFRGNLSACRIALSTMSGPRQHYTFTFFLTSETPNPYKSEALDCLRKSACSLMASYDLKIMCPFISVSQLICQHNPIIKSICLFRGSKQASHYSNQFMIIITKHVIYLIKMIIKEQFKNSEYSL